MWPQGGGAEDSAPLVLPFLFLLLTSASGPGLTSPLRRGNLSGHSGTHSRPERKNVPLSPVSVGNIPKERLSRFAFCAGDWPDDYTTGRGAGR